MSVNAFYRQKSIDRLISRIENPVGCIFTECVRLRTRRPDGYATFGNREHGLVPGEIYAHRIVYTLVHGRIPKDYEVDHRCRTHNCVNPLHLQAITLQENRQNWERIIRPHCKFGHPKRTRPSGVVYCPTCLKAATATWLDKPGNRESQNAWRRDRRKKTS